MNRFLMENKRKMHKSWSVDPMSTRFFSETNFNAAVVYKEWRTEGQKYSFDLWWKMYTKTLLGLQILFSIK